MIANNLDVNVWVFKIDDEVNGRGHAWLDVDHIRTVIELRKKKVDINEAIITRIQDVLSKLLPRKAKLAQQKLYGDFEGFMAEFCRVGGVIEAAPPLCQMSQL